MGFSEEVKKLSEKYISAGDHGSSDYFALIKELVGRRNRHEKGSAEFIVWQEEIDRIYGLIGDELISNNAKPITPIKFGTSGWRGIIGKDLYVKSVHQVTQAIVAVFQEIEGYPELAKALGVETFFAAQTRGCVVGFDNRFGGKFWHRQFLMSLQAAASGYTMLESQQPEYFQRHCWNLMLLFP